ncbi:MAG: DinB family protein [Cyclobacteriaceae bacterium]|nr:DinB family protein [Cyclobacteriaceae bacterium SS2]
MKPQNIFILSLVSFLVIAYSALAEISKKEREMAITYLSDTKQELLNTVKSLNNDQLNFKVNEEIWSIAECIEHLAISEHLIFEWSQNAILNSG